MGYPPHRGMAYYPNDTFIPQSSCSSGGSNSHTGGGYYRQPQTINPHLLQPTTLNYPVPSYSTSYQTQTAYAQPQKPTIAPPRPSQQQQQQQQQQPTPIPPDSQLPAYTHLSPSKPSIPPSVPDAGDYLRQKHNISQGVEVNLYALPDPAPGTKPSYSLPCLIALAIYGSPRKMLTLKQIYGAIEERFEWHRLNPTGGGWKNSIRHNLSLNLIFRKQEKPITEYGKGCYWYIDISDGEGTKRDRKRGRSAYARDEDDRSIGSFDEDPCTMLDSFDAVLDNFDAVFRDAALGRETSYLGSRDTSSLDRDISSVSRHRPSGRWSSSPRREVGMNHNQRYRRSALRQPVPMPQQQQQQQRLVPTGTPLQFQYGLSESMSHSHSPSYHDAYLTAVGLNNPRPRGQFYSAQ